jgi:hypothetical protein
MTQNNEQLEPAASSGIDPSKPHYDQEIWCGPEISGDYPDSLFITREGWLGIACGGSAHVRPIRDWHRMAERAEFEPTAAQVRSACLSYRHDYGSLDHAARDALQFEAREWLRAWQKDGLGAAPASHER